MPQRYLPFAHTALLLVLCGVLYFPYLGNAPFFNKGEPREAMAVQDIVRRGEWLVPLKRATDVPSKPPLFHWSAAAVYHLTGNLDEVTLRLPSAFFATVGVLLLYFLARRLWTADIALLAGAILATTMIYQDQALDARVDMTLCFFVMLSLTLFYSLYREILSHPAWYYAFFAVTGIGTLAKGPLGLLLPALVAGVFVLLRRRWDLVRKFCFHPGVGLMFVLAAGWYVIAVTRGGEGFFDRQIMEENLHRFVGGSGHSHPVYYYIPYLFAQGLPWAMLLPVALWDGVKKGPTSGDDTLFLKLWFALMFVFFSISLGKRPVYLLPLYPALAILMAVWLVKYDGIAGARSYYYRAVALFAVLTGVILLLVVVGELWNQNPSMLFSPIELLLKPKDRANFALVSRELAAFGWPFALATLASALLWFSLARCLWSQRLLAAAPRLVLITVVFSFIARGLVVPKIAAAKSYRPFMLQVNQLVGPNNKVYLYRSSFNSDQVVFYRGEPVETLNPSPEEINANIGQGDAYLIMAEREWRELQKVNANLPPPLLKSFGTGPEGNAPLVLVRTAESK
jgi:4-amino-4-deoxy-L-arabinose transferase-like glycosyltransferase